MKSHDEAMKSHLEAPAEANDFGCFATETSEASFGLFCCWRAGLTVGWVDDDDDGDDDDDDRSGNQLGKDRKPLPQQDGLIGSLK